MKYLVGTIFVTAFYISYLLYKSAKKTIDNEKGDE